MNDWITELVGLWIIRFLFVVTGAFVGHLVYSAIYHRRKDHNK